MIHEPKPPSPVGGLRFVRCKTRNHSKRCNRGAMVGGLCPICAPVSAWLTESPAPRRAK